MKKFKFLPKGPILYSASALCIGAIVAASVVTNTYEGLIDVFFSSSEYKVTEVEALKCKEVVEEGSVLLKNENNALPLQGNEKIALLGQNSYDFVYAGAGSGSFDTSICISLEDALNQSGFSVNQTISNFYKTGEGKSYRKECPDETGSGTFTVNEVPFSKIPSSFTDEFKSCSLALVTIGRSGGESSDLPTKDLASGYNYLELDADELATIKLACSNFEKVILIANTNNPISLKELNESEYANIKACLWIGGVGQEGIKAIPEILKGTINPSGRLPDTFAYDSLSAPATVNLGNYTITNSNVEKGNKYLVMQEGIYTGYRYYETRYEDSVLNRSNVGTYDYETTVQFPFGYGLSYTNFTWSDVEMVEKEDTFEFSLTVKNEGPVAGKDVVEMYIQKPYTTYDIQNNVEKSSVELVGMKKTSEIKAGAEETVTITINKDDMKSYDSKNAKGYIVDDGTYYFSAGRDAHDALNNILEVKGFSAEGNKQLVTSYEQTEFQKILVDATTGNPITNQFEDVDANYYDECTYLSRNNWEGTYPLTAYKNGSWTASSTFLSDLEFFRDDEVINDPNAIMPKFSSTATSYMIQDLVNADYDDPRWDDIVNQLTVKQATRLIRLGGYSTISIDAIGLPKTIDKDGPAGFSNTLIGGTAAMGWPTEVVMASTWNEELIEETGKLIGEESIETGITGWYAPGANNHRTAYSGRNFEYFSEDGCLTGKIGAAEMRGVRSKGVIAYMKHFALNDQETNRGGGAYFATEQAIRENSLKGFELITKEGKAIAAMCSMNRFGARWAGAHQGLMTEVLRNEWGFEGFTITDQASVAAMFYQDHISGLWAGNDMWLNTGANYWLLDDYFENATVMSNVHKACKNILYGIAHSNAVDSSFGNISSNNVNIFPWRALLITADVLLGLGAAFCIIYPTTRLIIDKKKKKEE